MCVFPICTQRNMQAGGRDSSVYTCKCFIVDACVKTHSVVEGEERSVAMLPCLLSCCSLGEDGSESVISSISSWADWDLVFFLLNACLKELRNCKTDDTNAHGAKCVNITNLYIRNMSLPKNLILVTSHPVRSGSHAVPFPSNGHCLV